MTKLKTVDNISFDKIASTHFDIGIFASGYESRSSYLASQLKLENIKYKIVLGFLEHQNNSVRSSNDCFYINKGCTPYIISSQEEEKIYEILIEVFARCSKNEQIRILLDYTSMSRLWYSGILNFMRFQSQNIEVYLNYSLGDYTDRQLLDYSYSSINSLPSHEGSLSSNNKTLLVLAIGFSPYLIKSVIEEIEPNKTIGVLPIPNIKKQYETHSREIKENLLIKDIDDWIMCPINNLESVFRTYAEITNNNINERDLIFLSLGPKIFTLASILVSQRFEQVTCLYLKAVKGNNNDVQPSGEFICSKIRYEESTQ